MGRRAVLYNTRCDLELDGREGIDAGIFERKASIGDPSAVLLRIIEVHTKMGVSPCEPDRGLPTAAPRRLERKENVHAWSLLLARRETDKTSNCASSTPSSAFVSLKVRMAGGAGGDILRCVHDPIAPDSAGLTFGVRKKELLPFRRCVRASDHGTRIATPKQGQTATI